MIINPKIKLRETAGEHYVMVPGKAAGDIGRVVAFNGTSLLLWQSLQGRDFTLAEVQQVLLQHYEVDEATALRDASAWVQQLQDMGVIL